MEPTLRDLKRERTRDAIVETALRLFAERGYAAVTVEAIARAAEVGERTVYRRFADKEELLFADDEALRAAVVRGARAAPADARGAAVIEAVARAVADHLEPRRARLTQRAAVIAASAALQGREAAKQAGYRVLLAEQLVRGGHPAARASLLSGIGVTAFTEATARWLAGPADRALDAHVADVLAETAALLG